MKAYDEYNKYINKKNYRKGSLELRHTLDIKDISSKIITNIAQSNIYSISKNILSFFPIDNEIDLRDLYQDHTKHWFLPRCKMRTKELFVHSYNTKDELTKNKWDILEPKEHLDIIDPEIIDLIIIPALLVDKKGYRIGYGAGFYDRFIPKLKPECIKTVPVADIFIKEELPVDEWDLPVDFIFSETRIIDVKN